MPDGSVRGEAEPEPVPSPKRYYPRGWRIAFAVLVLAMLWLLVGVFWRPDWWPGWDRPDWGIWL